MVGMPYHLEKGPWLCILEDYINADEGRAVAFLEELRSRSDRMAKLSFVASPALNDPRMGSTPEERQDHLARDWFGFDPPDFVAETLALLPENLQAGIRQQRWFNPTPSTADGVVEFAREVADLVAKTPGAGLNGWPSTGFWFQYHGDVDGIVRETLIRGLEVAFGLEHDQEVPREGLPRRLPVELFWKCPQRWFEGWVSWRWNVAYRTGHVMIMLATPGSGKPVLERPGDGHLTGLPTSSRATSPGSPPAGPGPGDRDPDDSESPLGLWVISHAEHAQLPSTPDDNGSTVGQWSIPPFGPSYVGTGEIITVAPSEIDGGVRPYGRPFEEPDRSLSSS